MSALRRAWPAAGPVLLALLLAARALAADGLEPAIGVGIGAIFVAVGVLAAARSRWAPVALAVPPIAFVASPARTELSYNLARPGDTGWFLFTLAIAAGIGLCVATALALGVDRRATRLAFVPVAGLGAVGFAALLGVVDPQPDLGRDLDDAARAALVTVEMVNFGYAAEPVEIVDGRLRFRLVNDSDLPHTFSVDAIDLDVYVPPGRTTYVDVAVPDDLADLDVYCGVGDHVAQGMVVRLPIR